MFDKDYVKSLLQYLTKTGKLDHNLWWVFKGAKSRFLSNSYGFDYAGFFKKVREGDSVIQKDIRVALNTLKRDSSAAELMFEFFVEDTDAETFENMEAYEKAWEDMLGRIKIACDRSYILERIDGDKAHRYEVVRFSRLPKTWGDNSLYGVLTIRVNLAEEDFR